MSAPLKPWERAGAAGPANDPGGVPPCCLPGGGGPLDPLRNAATPTAGLVEGAPPPVPTRSAALHSSMYGGSYNGLSSYGGPGSYSSYGGIGSYGGFSTGSMYSPYGSGMYGSSMYGGYGMNRFGADNQPNSFVQMAEENSRQAFQSIEGIVQAVGSVAMMLESTYSAVYNSFRAVIGVADHFSRMKATFAQVFSALAFVRTLRWLVRRLLVLFRLREAVPHDEIWSEATAAGLDAAGQLTHSGKKSGTAWPLLLFFGVIMAGPWLIWRFLSSLQRNKTEDKGWASGEGEHFVAVAEFDFEGEKDDELSVRRGQRINIAPKEQQPRIRGWLLGSVDGQQVGIIPANYIKILGKRPGTKTQHPTTTVPTQYTGPAPLPHEALAQATVSRVSSCCGRKAEKNAGESSAETSSCCGGKSSSVQAESVNQVPTDTAVQFGDMFTDWDNAPQQNDTNKKLT